MSRMSSMSVVVAAVVICVVCSSVGAMYEVAFEGLWPKTWPGELEGLRKQAKTLSGPMVGNLHYEIPFKTRDEFEAAWPHLLKVKSKGAPVVLVRKPMVNVYDVKAGVIVHAPPPGQDKKAHPEEPVAGQTHIPSKWMWTTYIEVVVDGQIVDLNRIPLPEGLILDERFKEEKK